RRRRLTVRTSNAVIVIAVANDAIARARRVLQSNTIDDVDAAMPILDEAGLLRHARGDGYTGATNAQHESQKFLCERKFVSADADRSNDRRHASLEKEHVRYRPVGLIEHRAKRQMDALGAIEELGVLRWLECGEQGIARSFRRCGRQGRHWNPPLPHENWKVPDGRRGRTSTQARCRKNDGAWRRLVAPDKDNGKHRQREKRGCARNGITPLHLYGIVRKILVKYMSNKTLRLYPARRTIHPAARRNESTNRLWSR